MFDLQVEELYKYLTKKELKKLFEIVRLERKSVVQYKTEKYKWVLLPLDSEMTIENYELNYNVKDTTYLFFIDDLDFGEIRNRKLCRELTQKDELHFTEFKNGCSEEDKEEGMVSLEDDFVYGLFVNDKIVAVSSLWNWGDVISDIGILVHPNYRNKGYAKSVCQTLMSNIDKKFVWRCDEKNKASFNLATSIGFIKAGIIQELEEVKKDI